jgi:hypothetical protein
MELSLDLAAMDGGHAENAGAFFGPANEVFSHLKPAPPLKFNVCSSISQIDLHGYVVECTMRVKGRGAGPVYETSLAWMPTEASGMCLCVSHKLDLCRRLAE